MDLFNDEEKKQLIVSLLKFSNVASSTKLVIE